ncbi:MAG: M20 family metallopeptidase [Acetobacteraceae bacterium]|nr:M20 family metallopeptidase [Acetobacteraceae bacterium]
MTGIAARVAANEGAMLAFLERLVNTESPTEDRDLAERAAELLEGKAQSIGMEVARDKQDRFADNRVCRLNPAGAPRVLMIGHFDTVYPRGTVATRPFRIEHGRACGCGVLDMKGGLTAGLYALQAIQEAGRAPRFATTFILNSDEEIGSPCSRRVILEEAARHDIALVLEPGVDGPGVVMGRKGVGIWHFEVEGAEAHAGAEPEKGANAVVEMAHKILNVTGLARPELGTTVNAGVIEGGTKPYVVPGRCRLEVDIRVPSAAEQARVEAGLRDLVARSAVPRTRTNLRGSFHRPPMESSEAAWTHLSHLQQIATAAGYPLQAERSGGASDGNLTAAAGLPTIDGLGPHGGGAHSPHEFMEVRTLALKTRILAEFLAGLRADG